MLGNKTGKTKLNMYKKIIAVLITFTVVIFTIFVVNRTKNLEVSSKKEETTQENLNVHEITVNGSNIKYSTDKENKGIVLNEYNGGGETVIVPKEIEGQEVKEINTDAFSQNYNLETIKIPKDLADNIGEIKDFKVKEETKDDEYVEYETTREYSELYKEYMALSKEEKAKQEIIPDKFSRPLEDIYSSQMEELYGVSTLSEETIPDKYDLREHIDMDVEDQSPFGTCYSYGTLLSVETNIALKQGEVVDLSEIHLAVMSKQGYGGLFSSSVEDYFTPKLGPVFESDWSKDTIVNNKLTDSTEYNIIDKHLNGESVSKDELKRAMYTVIYNYCDKKHVDDKYLNFVIEQMGKTKPVVNVTETTKMPSITITDKNDESKAQMIEDERNIIKKHIMENGSLCATIYMTAYYKYKGNMVKNNMSNYSGLGPHAVGIVGWDDNFPKENFPSIIRPKENGAYLVLNSWGKYVGTDGYIWISYEDWQVENDLQGVTVVDKVTDNLNAQSMTIQDTDNSNIIKNNQIKSGENIKIAIDVGVNELKNNKTKVNVTIKNEKEDKTNKVQITGTTISNKKAPVVINMKTREFEQGTYIIEIEYEGEVIRKSITIKGNPFEYSINEDTNSITIEGYVGEEKNIEIPKKYLEYDVTGISDNVFNNGNIESIKVYENVTNIGKNIISKGTIIYGNSGSKIEQYANDNGYTFITTNQKKLSGEFWDYDIENKTLNITGLMEEYNNQSLVPWYGFRYNIYKIKITNTSRISKYAFYGIKNVETITIPNTVTSIGQNAFEYCTNLTNIQLSDKITKIEPYTFLGCEKLSLINIPSGVKEIGTDAFYSCTSLSSIDIPIGIKEIDFGIFWNCYNLSTVSLHEGITSIRKNAFRESGITEINIPESVTSIEDEVFSNCYNLISVNMSDGLLNMGQGVFSRCENLQEIDMSKNYVEIPENTFLECISLQSIHLPEIITKIGEKAFFGCLKLSDVNLPERLTNIGKNAFGSTSALDNSILVYLGDNLTIESRAFSPKITIYKKKSATIVNYSDAKITENGLKIQYKKKNIINVNSLNQESEIKYSIDDGADRTVADGQIDISGLDDNTEITFKVYINSDMLVTTKYTVEELKKFVFEYTMAYDEDTSENYSTIIITKYIGPDSIVNIPEIYEGYTVTHIDENIFNFAEVADIEVYNISRTITDIEIGTFTLLQQRNLKEINVAPENENYSSVEGVLYNKAKTTLLKYPPAKENTSYTIDSNTKSIRTYAFFEANNLNYIQLPTGLTSISSNAFYYCKNLKSIEIPNTVSNIGPFAFIGSINLENVKLSNSLLKIQNGTFQNCTNLKIIEIPSSVTSIGANAFQSCKSLTKIEIPKNVTDINNTAFSGAILNIPITMSGSENTKELELPDILKRAKTNGDILYTTQDFTLTNCSLNSDKNKVILSKQNLKDGPTISVVDGSLKGFSVKYIVNVEQAQGSITNIQDLSKVYDGEAVSDPTYTKVGDGTVTIEFYSGNSATGSKLGSNPKNAGTYTVKVILAETENYSGATETRTFTISKATYNMANVQFNNKSFVYDGTQKQITITGNLPQGVRVSYENNTRTEVGQTLATAKFTGDTTNYNTIQSKTATLTITQAQGKITNIQDLSKIYDGEAVSDPTYTKVGDGTVTIEFYSGNSATGSKLGSNPKNAGTYTVKVILAVSTNYSGATATKTFTISKATYNMANVQFNNKSFVYDGTQKQITITGNLPQGVRVSYENNTRTEVGQTLATASFTGDTTNYNTIQSKTATLTITKAQGSITDIQDLSKIYDGEAVSNPTYTKVGDGDVTIEFYSGENTSGVKLNSNPVDKGTYTVKIILSDGNNYKGTVATAKFTITESQGSITNIQDLSKVYDGEAVSNPTYKKVGDGTVTIEFYSGGSATGSKLESNPKNAGTYTVKVILASTKNYSGATATKTFTISKATYNMTDVEFNNKSFVYDGTQKEITITGNLPQGVKVSYENNTGIEVGEYHATAKFTGDETNYNAIENKAATLTITQAEGKITNIQDLSKIYDGEAVSNPTYTKVGDGKVTIEFYNGEDVTGTKLESNPKKAGTYTVKVTLSSGKNYKGASETRTFVISKANPNYTIPTGLKAQVGQTLKDIKLPENFSWEKDLNTKVGEAGQNQFTVKYTPEDTENYNIVTGIKVIVTVTEDLKIDLGEYTKETEGNKSYIKGIKPDITKGDLVDNIKTNGTIGIYKDSREITNNSEKLSTGMILKINLDTKTVEYEIVVTGDLTGDGLMNGIDLLKLARYETNLDTNLNGAYLKAANVYNNDNVIDGKDLLKLARVLVHLDVL